MSDFDPELAAKRLRDAIEWIGERKQHGRGWQRSAARMLGISPTYVSRVLSGNLERTSEDVTSRAAGALRLDPAWFQSDGQTSIGKYYRAPEAPSRLTPQQRRIAAQAGLSEEEYAEARGGERKLRVLLERARQLLSVDLYRDSTPARVEACKELARCVLDLRLIEVARDVDEGGDPGRTIESGTRLASLIVAESVEIREALAEIADDVGAD